MAFIYDLTDTWNAGGTTFNAIKMNVTDTASAAASKLVTLQVGGSERFSVDKAGNVLIGNGGDLQISSATGGNNSTLYNDAQDLYITTNGSTRMYINSSGNVGIGNVSPGTRLDVTGNIRLSAAAPVIEWNSGGAQVYAPAANTLAIATGGGIGSPVERLRVDSSGNVGIGTSSPANPLTINGITEIRSGNYLMLRPSGNAWDMRLQATGTQLDILSGGALGSPIMSLVNGGNVGIGTSSPGTRLQVRDAAAPSGFSSTSVRVTRDNYGADFSGYIDQGVGHGATISTVNNGTPTERMRINGSGNVGIGTSAPVDRLQVEGNLYFGTSNRVVYTGGAGNLTLQTNTGVLAFNTGGSVERMRIDNAGNVGVGVTPGAWNTGARVIQAGGYASFGLARGGTSDALMSWNALVTGAGSSSGTGYTYRTTGDLASSYEQNGTHRWYVAAAGTAGNAISFTEAMRIASSGNVGIGTSSPSFAKLQVCNSGAEGFEFATAISAGVNRILSYNRATNAYVTLRLDGSTQEFYTGGAERARIDSSGYLLVGTSSTFDNVSYLVAQFQGGVSTKIAGTGATSQMSFFNNNGRVGYIGTDGTTTTYYTSSDARLKHDIVNAPDAADLIDAIKVRSFKWNADNSEQRYGFVAQELLEVAPEAVGGTPDGDEMMAVDYSKLVPMLIKEVQSLRARVAQLETSAATITFEGN